MSYLTTDHLGSPRVITDQNGAVISRKDFAAFGDETITTQRNLGLGYNPPNVRQDYTGYQKDAESNLEYAQARYYSSQTGRFTSVDPLTASASIKNPQTFNRYSYVLNSPYKFTDPLGLLSSSTGACGQWCPNSDGGGGLIGEGGGGYQDITKNFSEQQAEASQPPPRPVKITRESKLYKVQGRTAEDAVLDANKKAAKETVNGWGGETQVTKLDAQFTDADFQISKSFDKATGQFTVNVESTDVTVEATIKTTLPEWSNRDKASASERTLGEGYFKTLAGFEAEHTTDISNRLNELRDGLVGLKAVGTGESIEAAMTVSAASISSQRDAALATFQTKYTADAVARHTNGGHIIHIP